MNKQMKEQKIREMWLMFADLDTDDITELEAEIFALVAMHPALQDRLDPPADEPKPCSVCKGTGFEPYGNMGKVIPCHKCSDITISSLITQRKT